MRRFHAVIPLLFFVALSLGLSACVVARAPAAHFRATPTATLTPTPTATLIPTATPTPLPPILLPAAPAATPRWTPTPIQASPILCAYRVRFLADLTIPDGTVLSPGQPFTKTWRLQNVSPCPWTPDFRLVLVDGEPMNGPRSQPLAQVVPPGQSVDLSVPLVAPTQPGAYTSRWMLQTPDGHSFGLGDQGQTPFWVKITIP